MKIEIRNRCSDFTSYRAARVKSLFNAESGCNFDLDAELDLSGDWSIGVVVGPSGSGKTSIGRQIFGDPAPFWTPEWPVDKPIIDAIAPEGDFNAVTGALGSVGLGSAPISRAWSAMRPSARSWTSSHRSLTGRLPSSARLPSPRPGAASKASGSFC